MIPLRIAVEPLPIEEPVVLRLRTTNEPDQYSDFNRDAILTDFRDGVAEFDAAGFSLRLTYQHPGQLHNDVIMLLPGQRTAHRLVRASSRHNTFLVTEQCDQVCVMCSQPPKKHHVDLFQQYEEAAVLAPENAVIGISGGEPLLHKAALFRFLENVTDARPDLRFHVLTNAQHFTEQDIAFLKSSAAANVLWGVPLYATEPTLHDRIVGKGGAFGMLSDNLSLLAFTGADVELRTVILTENASNFSDLARFVTLNLPFVNFWAIMQLENIGFGRKNWDSQFLDTSLEFSPVADAIDIAGARGIEVCLYNFPACTVPTEYRHHATRSISDWKQKYLDVCSDCTIKELCGGFFQWYPEKNGFRELGLQ